MPKITTFLYCEGAQNEITPQGPKLHLVGPLLKLTPMFIPSMFSFSVLINIQDINVEIPHTLRFVFKEPSETEQNVLDTGDMAMPKQIDNVDSSDEIHSIMMSMDFRNIVLKHEGIYKGIVYFDGEMLGEYPITAKAVGQNEQSKL